MCLFVLTLNFPTATPEKQHPIHQEIRGCRHCGWITAAVYTEYRPEPAWTCEPRPRAGSAERNTATVHLAPSGRTRHVCIRNNDPRRVDEHQRRQERNGRTGVAKRRLWEGRPQEIGGLCHSSISPCFDLFLDADMCSVLTLFKPSLRPVRLHRPAQTFPRPHSSLCSHASHGPQWAAGLPAWW